MKKVLISMLAIVLVLSILTPVAVAGTIQYYFAIATNNHRHEFFYSEIFTRDFHTYNTQAEDTVAWKDILFLDPDLHSAGIIRAKSREAAEAKIEQYIETYKKKGWPSTYVNWTPLFEEDIR